MNGDEAARACGRKRKLTERKWFRSALLSAAILFTVALALVCRFLPVWRLLPAAEISAREEGELRVHFLPVGQGDCAVLEFPEGDALVIDGGDGSFESVNVLCSYLKALNLPSLTLVATHADRDHIGGLSSVLERFPVQKLWLPVLESEDSESAKLIAAADSRGIEREAFTRYGGEIRSSGVEISCISPYSAGETDENDASVLLYVSYGDVRMLFGGDISSVREKRLLREYAADESIFDCGERTVDLAGITLLKVSHHGADDSSCREWLELLSPECAVVSCGRGNSYFHPRRGAMERLREAGAQIYRTDELGAVVFRTKGNGYSVGYGERI